MSAPALLGVWVGMMALHQDFWFAGDRTLLFGVLPVHLAYQVGYTLLAAGVMALFVRRAWPVELERLEHD